MTEHYLKIKENALKIERSISNIIWLNGLEKFNEFIHLVSNSLYLSAIELSLYNIFEKSEITSKELFDLRNNITEENVNISGLHNIFADSENFKDSFFSSDLMFEKTAKRIEEYIDYARMLHIENLSLDYMTFLNRENISEDEADSTFLKLLTRIDKYANDDVKIHIAPMNKENRDYLNKYVDAIELIKKARFQNIKVLLDLKEIFSTLSFDLKYFKDNRDYINHFHISNLDGGAITFTDIPMHNKMVNTSFSQDYTNNFFVMKINNLTAEEKSDIENYEKYIHVFKEIYQVPLELSPFCSKLFMNFIYRHISAEGPDIEHLYNYDIH